MSSERKSERFSKRPYVFSKSSNLNEDVPVWSEGKIAIYGLILSLLVLTVKFFTTYRESLEKTFLEQKLISYKVFTEDGTEMFMYSWKTAAKYSNIWLPMLCGILTSYFTWIMVYLDSEVPGVQPPSPFSPKKYKLQSGHTFHLNYVFAIIIGFLVASYLYLRGVSITY